MTADNYDNDDGGGENDDDLNSGHHQHQCNWQLPVLSA